MQKTIIRLLQETAKEQELDYEVVEAIYQASFRYPKEAVIGTDFTDFNNFKYIRFTYLGTLRPKEFVWKKLQKKNTSDTSEK